MSSIIGERIKERRQWHRMQQDELAALVRKHAEGRSVHTETLSRIENGRNAPAAWMLVALAQALRTSVDYLVGLTASPDLPSEPAYPVPDPEIAHLVAALNALQPARRSRLRRIVEAIMAFAVDMEPAGAEDNVSHAQPGSARTQEWVQRLDALSEEQFAAFQAWFEQAPAGPQGQAPDVREAD